MNIRRRRVKNKSRRPTTRPITSQSIGDSASFSVGVSYAKLPRFSTERHNAINQILELMRSNTTMIDEINRIERITLNPKLANSLTPRSLHALKLESFIFMLVISWACLVIAFPKMKLFPSLQIAQTATTKTVLII